MASINELINLSRYKAGDYGREGLNGKGPDFTKIFKSPQQQQAEQLNLQALALKVQQLKQQAEIARRQKELWDSIGAKNNADKTTRGITNEVIDNPDAPASRDAKEVGDYKLKLTPSGKLGIYEDKTKPIKYDKVKVMNRAKDIVEADLLELGIDRKSWNFASMFNERIKAAIPKAEEDLGMSSLRPEPPPEKTMPINPTGKTSFPEDFLPQYQHGTISDVDVKRKALKEMPDPLSVAKDFYFGGNKKPTSQSSAQPAQQNQEGQTAINPETKKRLVYKGGKWLPLN